MTATNAAKAERDRIAAILALPEARGREDEATRLAMTTDMTVDQVKTKFTAETSAAWDAALTARGMKIGGAAPQAGADPWSETLQRRGFAVGG